MAEKILSIMIFLNIIWI